MSASDSLASNIAAESSVDYSCYSELDRKSELAARRSKIPMRIADLVIKIATDRDNTSLLAVQTIAFLAHYADAEGNLGKDAMGRSIADPKHIADAIGGSTSSVFRVLANLHDRGYVNWERANRQERHIGATGTVRLIPQSVA